MEGGLIPWDLEGYCMNSGLHSEGFRQGSDMGQDFNSHTDFWVENILVASRGESSKDGSFASS